MSIEKPPTPGRPAPILLGDWLDQKIARLEGQLPEYRQQKDSIRRQRRPGYTQDLTRDQLAGMSFGYLKALRELRSMIERGEIAVALARQLEPVIVPGDEGYMDVEIAGIYTTQDQAQESLRRQSAARHQDEDVEHDADRGWEDNVLTERLNTDLMYPQERTTT